MTHRPLLGSHQLETRTDGGPPLLRVRALVLWRANDGSLLPRNEALSTDYVGRSTSATIFDTDGTSGPLAASEPAFTSVDWDLDGAREADALLLSTEEALRIYDRTTGRLRWDMGPKTLRYDWIETGAAEITDAPLWSFTTDDTAGAYLALLGTGTGGVAFEHHNATSSVVSTVPVSAGDCCSLRAVLHPDGSVEAALTRNGAARELLGERSDALALADEWGDGGSTLCRVNESGDSTRGTQLARYLAVYGAVLTRKQLLEVL